MFIISNLIKGNSAQTNSLGGGGIDIYNCETNTPVIENNVIVDNYSSVLWRWGICRFSIGELIQIWFDRNQNTVRIWRCLADQYLTNNTIYNNNADVCGGGIYTHDMTSNIMNCILWGNTAPVDRQISGTATVTYSDVDGGWTGTGNINEFPLFDMGSEFYHLLEIFSLCRFRKSWSTI